MKRLFTFIIVSFLFCFGGKAITAEKVLSNAADVFSKAGSIEATYTFSSAKGGNSKGNIKVDGKKYKIEMPHFIVWYDGNNQWEYVVKMNQCTLSTPTSQELSQLNHYAILNSYKNSYKATSVKSNIKGTYAIRLTPLSSNSPISKATIFIKASDWQPVRLDILDKTGNLSTILVTGISLGKKFNESTFTFDKKNYPGVELIDLR